MNFICGAQNQRILLKIYNNKNKTKKKPQVTANIFIEYELKLKSMNKKASKMPYKRPNG